MSTPVATSESTLDVLELQRQRVQKRTLIVIVFSQILGGAGLAAGVAVGALLAQQMLGSDTLAGLPIALFTLGSAIAAYLIGRFTQRWGRRTGLSLGFIVGGLGASGVVVAAVTNNIALLMVALFIYGAGTAANLQARYAGTDLALPDRRGLAVSVAMVATTLGAVAGPNLIEPLGTFAVSLGIPALAGPFLLAAAAYMAAGLVLFVLLRPDPYLLAKQIAASTATGETSADTALLDTALEGTALANTALADTALANTALADTALADTAPADSTLTDRALSDNSPAVEAQHSDKALDGITRDSRTEASEAPPAEDVRLGASDAKVRNGVIIGATAMVLTQVAMVAIMTMTPVHMRAHNFSLTDVGLVISIHVAAMFLPSPVTGILVDRIGRIPMSIAAAITLLLAGITAAIAPTHSLPLLIVALALLGLGWNFGVIAGTALVVDATPPERRGKTQGSIDVLVALAGAGGGAASGIVMAIGGYNALALIGGCLSLLLLPVLWWTQRNQA